MNPDFQNKHGYPEFEPFQDENCFRHIAEQRAELDSWEYERVQVSDLVPGDTVFVNGRLETVDGRNLKYDKFMGWSYKDSVFHKGITKATSKAEIERRKVNF